MHPEQGLLLTWSEVMQLRKRRDGQTGLDGAKDGWSGWSEATAKA